MVLILFSPEKEDICRDGEVPLAAKYNDAVLGEGKIGVTQFHHLTARQFFVVILRVHPSVKEHELVNIGPALAVEDQDL